MESVADGTTVQGRLGLLIQVRAQVQKAISELEGRLQFVVVPVKKERNELRKPESPLGDGESPMVAMLEELVVAYRAELVRLEDLSARIRL